MRHEISRVQPSAQAEVEIQERRRHERAALRFPIRLRLPTVEAVLSSEALNISHGGMFIAMDEPPAVGTQLDIEVELQDGTLLLHTSGEVVRVQEPPAPPGVGVRLLEVSYEAHALIQRLLHDGHVFGKYRLETLVGRGGMAEIYSAVALTGEHAGRRVAVKRIRPDLCGDTRILELFVRESRVTRMLRHPNIIEVIDVGTAGGAYYIAMDFVDGVNLWRIIKECAGRGIFMPIDFACYVASTVAGALDYAHRACDADGVPLGIVHRDVTPSNIFVSKMGEILLGDFGVAHIARMSPPGEDRVNVGKCLYWAPEQVQGKPVTPASDVFAMGSILYETLVNRPPFLADDQLAIQKRILRGRVEPLRNLRPDVPEALEQFVLKALGRRLPAAPGRAARWLPRLRGGGPQRYADAASFARDLDELYDHRIGNQTAIAAVVHNLFRGPGAMRRENVGDTSISQTLRV